MGINLKIWLAPFLIMVSAIVVFLPKSEALAQELEDGQFSAKPALDLVEKANLEKDAEKERIKSSQAENVDSEKEEKAEIIYVEARLLANDGNFEEALPLALQANALSPNHLGALELILEASRVLKKDDLIQKFEPLVLRANARQNYIESIEEALGEISELMKEEEWNEALIKIMALQSSPGHEAADDHPLSFELWFRRGVCHLNLGEKKLANVSFKKAGLKYAQQAYFIHGLMYRKRGYYAESVRSFKRASDATLYKGSFDKELGLQAQEWAEKIRNVSFSLQGILIFLSDNNPFGLPRDRSTFSDGSPNKAELASLSMRGFAAGLIPSFDEVFYKFNISGTQKYTPSQDARKTLNTTAYGGGLTTQFARADVGRIGPSYEFQSIRAPTFEAGQKIGYRETHQLQNIQMEWTKNWSQKVEATLLYKLTLNAFNTANDTGPNDRSGKTQGAFWQNKIKTGYRWLIPSFEAGYQWNDPKGYVQTEKTLRAFLANSGKIFSKDLDFEVKLEWEQSYFPLFSSGGRVDQTWKPVMTFVYSFSPNLAAVFQAQMSRTNSNLSYYTQDRLLFASGIAFGIF